MHVINVRLNHCKSQKGIYNRHQLIGIKEEDNRNFRIKTNKENPDISV